MTITELTELINHATELAKAAGGLSAAVAGLVSPWTTTIVAAFGAWWARRSLVATKEGNDGAVVAVKAAADAAHDAKAAAELAQQSAAEVKQHSETQAFLIEKGLERDKFEKAIAIGAEQERQRTSPAPLTPNGK